METKFTPGPWLRCCDCGDILQEVHPIREATVIATVSPENKAANMALICAAPELYAYADAEDQLSKHQQSCEECDPRYGEERECTVYRGLVAKLQPYMLREKALAKARGE